jgi:monofunctional biosynthetic peptidoglycan transglycosylase
MSSPRGRFWAALALAAVGALALYEVATWPDAAPLARAFPKSTAFLDHWRDRERAAGRSGKADWRPVPWSRISIDLKLAVLAGEDADFFAHHGFAIGEIKDAVAEAWRAGEMPRGASTITQQLAKNLWLSPSRNPWRKVKEAMLTRQLERKLSKRRILELYLDVAEFGPGVWGAEAAAQRYFGIPAASLDARQAAELAASLPRPSQWHPGVATRGYGSAVARIETRMRSFGWLRREIVAAGALP